MGAKKLPDLYYGESGFWLRAGNRFIPVKDGHLEDQCRKHDLSMPGRWGLSDFRTLRAMVVSENFVDYAGPLAGHRIGCFQTTDGRKILVTSEPAGVFEEPGAKGDCAFIEKFLMELLGEGEQITIVLCWLKCAAEALRRGDFRPGQMLVLAGEGNSGKSFFHFLVTELLGGRSAKPYKWMIDKTAFNSDIGQAESLVIEDEVGHKDVRSRRAFGSMIKQVTVNETFDIHGKGKQAIPLPTFRRLHMSLNKNPEDMMVLPPLDNSISDKMTMVNCGVAKLSDDRDVNKKRLRAELPAFRRFLADMPIPKGLRNGRFGVKEFHHPDLVVALSELAPETALLGFIEDFLPATGGDYPNIWTGTAAQLEAELTRKEPSSARLFYGPNVCGQLLSKLAIKDPDRFVKKRSEGRDRWRIRLKIEG